MHKTGEYSYTEGLMKLGFFKNGETITVNNYNELKLNYTNHLI